MSLTPLEEARHALRLASRAVARATRLSLKAPVVAGQSIVESIQLLVDTVQGNPHLARSLHDCEQAFDRARSTARQGMLQLLGELCSLRKSAAEAFPTLIADEGRPADDASTRPRPSMSSLASFDQQIRNVLADPDDADRSDPGAVFGGALRPVETLRFVLHEGLQERGVPDDAPGLVDLRSRMMTVQDELRRIRTANVLSTRTHPVAKWRWLRSILEKCNPLPESFEWLRDLTVPEDEPIFDLMHDPGVLRDWAWLEEFRPRVAGAATAVEADLQARLGSRASLVWLLQRYARRCRWLRLAELQGEVADADAPELPKERALTGDAALFLFDQGLDVLIEQSLGQARYDVIGTTVLVEGKICSTNKPPLRAVVDGLSQIHSYVVQLASEGLTPEPVLLVFCTGGPSPDLPKSHTVGTVDVAIVLIDLAPASERGSRNKARVQVTTEDINVGLAPMVATARGVAI